jgi:hypothetical protein
MIFNLLYIFLFYRHTLWAFQAKTFDWLNHVPIDIIFSFFIIPVIIMICFEISAFRGELFIYTAIWIAYFSLLEYIFWERGAVHLPKRMGSGWSCFFNIIMFTMLRIHFKHSLPAILICIPYDPAVFISPCIISAKVGESCSVTGDNYVFNHPFFYYFNFSIFH